MNRSNTTEPHSAEVRDGLAPRGKLKAIWESIGAAVGVVMGLIPHVLHHIGLIAGAALVTGAAGNVLFFALGLVFSIPLLRRLYRKFRTPWAPAIAIAIFAALFSLSAFVIGPAITGDSSPTKGPGTPVQTPTTSHSQHH